MILIGLTGSIGMGKSTVGQMFVDLGAALWDADAAVHELYDVGGAGVGPIGKLFPSAIVDGAIDRACLSKLVLNDQAAMAALEAIIHPLVGDHRMAFIEVAAKQNIEIVILDIPLLLEGGSASFFHSVVVVSAPADMQRERVMARPGMSEAKFDAILSKQMPDSIKRTYADFIVNTGQSLAETKLEVVEIWTALQDELNRPKIS